MTIIRTLNESSTQQPTQDRRNSDANKKEGKPLKPLEEFIIGAGFAFEGKTIRLNQRDYDDWKEAYSAIPDLRAELKSLDDYYTSEKVDKWFPRTSAALAKKNAQYLAGKKTPVHQMTDAEYNALHSDLVTSNPMGGPQ